MSKSGVVKGELPCLPHESANAGSKTLIDYLCLTLTHAWARYRTVFPSCRLSLSKATARRSLKRVSEIYSAVPVGARHGVARSGGARALVWDDVACPVAVHRRRYRRKN